MFGLHTHMRSNLVAGFAYQCVVCLCPLSLSSLSSSFFSLCTSLLSSYLAGGAGVVVVVVVEELLVMLNFIVVVLFWVSVLDGTRQSRSVIAQ